MPTAFLTLVPHLSAARRTGAMMLAVFLCAALTPAFVQADPSDRGYVLKVPSALDTRWIDTHKQFIDSRLTAFERQHKEGARFKLVCDFNPDNRPSECDKFYACAALADYLVKLKDRNVLTIAYVHGEVTRHSVLPVLACAEIVFAEVGDPARPPALGRVTTSDRPLDNVERGFYERISVSGRWASAIIRKMYDAQLVVVKMPVGAPDPRFRDRKTAPGGEEIPELSRGNVALYTFADAVKYGLCQNVKPLNTLNDVLADYGLSAASLYEAPEQTVAWRVVISGELNGGLRERTERRIHRALGGKANVLILQLECHGGDGEAARRLAQFLLDLNKDRNDPVHTIAYVTPRAHDTAAFVAFACNEMIFDATASLDFEQFIQHVPKLEGVLRSGLVEVAQQSVYPPVLAEGMLSRDLRIHRVVSRNGDGRRKYLSDADYVADQNSDKPEWQSQEIVKPPSGRREDQNRYLELTADRARQLGLVADDGVVRNYEELCGKEGLAPGDVQTADADWLDNLADFLRNPWTSVVLVMIGVTCLILELKMPGVSLPGVLAAICFVLFFWAHAGFSTIGILAMLLFALGLLLVALEVFVLPGFGVPGVSGILLMLGSVGLVAYGHWPHSNSEWLGFGKTLSPFSVSILGAVVAAYIVAKYLPHVPYANRLFLKPPATATEETDGERIDTLRPELAALLGAIGVAATPLRPAGKVQFGEQFIDVVSESGYVQPGTRVQVVEIEGMRVVVKEV